MTDKEIEQALQDMALTTNWGSVERVGATNSDVNAVPKNIAIIQETLAYIDRLKAGNEKIRKETAKEILQMFTSMFRASRLPSKYDLVAIRDEVFSLAKKYDVEVEETR